ncbi:MAG: hypothetical protein R3A10_00405 [Caldilineaceae bacterium]
MVRFNTRTASPEAVADRQCEDQRPPPSPARRPILAAVPTLNSDVLLSWDVDDKDVHRQTGTLHQQRWQLGQIAAWAAT